LGFYFSGIFLGYFGHFGRSTGQPSGDTLFHLFVNEISQIFRHVRVLFYADDIKLFLPVRGFRDCLKIQNDSNRLDEWCKANALELNVGKYKSITFSRLGIILDRVDSKNDLGVIMDSKMSFTGHIDVAVGKALAMLDP
jgi:hypothetical protein